MSAHGPAVRHCFTEVQWDTPFPDMDEWDEIEINRVADQLRAMPSARAATPSGLSRASASSCQHGIPIAGGR